MNKTGESLSIASPTVSKFARYTSGLPGWLRPVTKLTWDAPHLTGDDRDEALDRLSPRPLPNEAIPINDPKEDDELAFKSWEFFIDFAPEQGAVDNTTKHRFARWIAHRFNRPAFSENIVGAVVKPILDNLRQMQKDDDSDLAALDIVREVRVAQLVGDPPYNVRLLFIIPEGGLPDKGLALARLVARMRDWFDPRTARLIAWEALHLYEISVGDYLDTEQIYLDHYTYLGQIIRGLIPPSNI